MDAPGSLQGEGEYKVVKTRVRRLVANPQRRKRARRKNPRHRRRMTAKQIKFFGTKRQKAALKSHRRRKTAPRAKPRAKVIHRSAGLKVSVNPSRRRVRARRKKALGRRRRQVNPALLVTLGAVNPRRQAVARKRRKKAHRAANPRRRRRNATRVVVTAPRRHRISHRRRRSNPRRRRNPAAFGLRGAGMAKAVVAGLAGVAAAKFLPTLVPANLIQSNLMRTLATGASAFVAQMLAKMATKDPTIADAVLFGGLMQTGSTALNAFLPSLARQLGLNGLGDIVDANWSIPENPLKALPVVPAANARAGVSGLDRAFGRAY